MFSQRVLMKDLHHLEFVEDLAVPALQLDLGRPSQLLLTPARPRPEVDVQEVFHWLRHRVVRRKYRRCRLQGHVNHACLGQLPGRQHEVSGSRSGIHCWAPLLERRMGVLPDNKLLLGFQTRRRRHCRGRGPAPIQSASWRLLNSRSRSSSSDDGRRRGIRNIRRTRGAVNPTLKPVESSFGVSTLSYSVSSPLPTVFFFYFDAPEQRSMIYFFTPFSFCYFFTRLPMGVAVRLCTKHLGGDEQKLSTIEQSTWTDVKRKGGRLQQRKRDWTRN